MWKRCAKSGLDLISGLGGVDERDGVDLGRTSRTSALDVAHELGREKPTR